jgi:hypothetical protein
MEMLIKSCLKNGWEVQKRGILLCIISIRTMDNIDSHSGFYKKWWEIIRDSIIEKTAEWIVGGIIGVAMLLLGNLTLTILKH